MTLQMDLSIALSKRFGKVLLIWHQFLAKEKIVSYTPIEWLRQELCLEPDTLMRLIAGVIPDPLTTKCFNRAY